MKYQVLSSSAAMKQTVLLGLYLNNGHREQPCFISELRQLLHQLETTLRDFRGKIIPSSSQHLKFQAYVLSKQIVAADQYLPIPLHTVTTACKPLAAHSWHIWKPTSKFSIKEVFALSQKHYINVFCPESPDMNHCVIWVDKQCESWQH